MKSKAMNPVLDFINTLCNFVALNLVFLITCLPVITIGTALSSLYYVTLREARGEYGYLVRTYLREFKNNFKKGTIAFAILFLIGAILLFNIAFWFGTERCRNNTHRCPDCRYDRMVSDFYIHVSTDWAI